MKLKQLFETLYLDGVEELSLFRDNVDALISRVSGIEKYDGQPLTRNDAILQFRKNGLPRQRNTIWTARRPYDKSSQAEIFDNSGIPSIKTFSSPQSLTKFIAKRRIGQRQQGQYINQMPDNPEEYVFQPLVNITAEFRVVVYYMNNKYHVSGIYKKIGSNVSVSNIPIKSKTGMLLSNLAIKATESLNYGLGGADIALLSIEDKEHVVGESLTGTLLSATAKIIGGLEGTALDAIIDTKIPVVLEVNSMPSVGNPAILSDLMMSIRSNIG